MFVKITRVNENNNKKELVVDTNEIVFLSETEPHVCYDKPTKFDEEYGEPIEWETEERFLIAFKNGKHPQFIDRENYEKLAKLLIA